MFWQPARKCTQSMRLFARRNMTYNSVLSTEGGFNVNIGHPAIASHHPVINKNSLMYIREENDGGPELEGVGRPPRHPLIIPLCKGACCDTKFI